eukprot:scaffold1044_cov120-Isochrysis_galbana.AAC.7
MASLGTGDAGHRTTDGAARRGRRRLQYGPFGWTREQQREEQRIEGTAARGPAGGALADYIGQPCAPQRDAEYDRSSGSPCRACGHCTTTAAFPEGLLHSFLCVNAAAHHSPNRVKDQ